MDILFTSPWILGSILLMPVAIIGLAKAWKRFRDKRAAQESSSNAS
jgi:hypothetical protein